MEADGVERLQLQPMPRLLPFRCRGGGFGELAGRMLRQLAVVKGSPGEAEPFLRPVHLHRVPEEVTDGPPEP
eukprot:2451536-Alexandrium_andersonii.AAC.1